MTTFTVALLEESRRLRAELLELERLENPPLRDRLGRLWKWKQGHLYTHCCITVPGDWVPHLDRHLSEEARSNGQHLSDTP